ncbi:MAG: hypothetical protein AAF467_27300 [Actinomycetota bacterium]
MHRGTVWRIVGRLQAQGWITSCPDVEGRWLLTEYGWPAARDLVTGVRS